MARKSQDKPLFIPQHKSKKVKFTAEVSSDLVESLKLYNEFLNANGHDSKLDDMVETILESIRKDKIFMKWTSANQTKDNSNPLRGASKESHASKNKEKISGAEA